MTPRLTVVIPTRDRPAMLERCLASVLASTGPDDDVLVIDSASHDADAVATIARQAGVPCIRCEIPGASTARNRGWRAATAPLVAFVDDDVWVEPEWAAALTACADRHPEAAWIAGRTEAPPDQTSLRGVAVLNQTEPAVIDTSTQSGRLGHSANLLVRVAALQLVDGFDEVLGAGGPLRAAEDMDLLDRILATGATGRFEPKAQAWHDQWRTPAEIIRLDWSYGIGNGARISKLARRPGSRRRALREVQDALWGWGLRQLGEAIRERFKRKAIMVFARIGGNFVGFALGMTFGTDNGHLRPRKPRPAAP